MLANSSSIVMHAPKKNFDKNTTLQQTLGAVSDIYCR